MLLLALVAAATPAAPAQIDCIEQSLTPAGRDAVRRSADLLANSSNGQVEPAAAKAMEDGLAAAMAVCRPKYGWSRAASEDAVVVVQAGYGLRALQARGRDIGIDAGKVEAAVRAMSAADRHALVTGAESGVGAFLAALTKAGVPMDNDARQSAAGQIAGLSIARDEARERFPTE